MNTLIARAGVAGPTLPTFVAVSGHCRDVYSAPEADEAMRAGQRYDVLRAAWTQARDVALRAPAGRRRFSECRRECVGVWASAQYRPLLATVAARAPS
jgi:hypothetical protein